MTERDGRDSFPPVHHSWLEKDVIIVIIMRNSFMAFHWLAGWLPRPAREKCCLCHVLLSTYSSVLGNIEGDKWLASAVAHFGWPQEWTCWPFGRYVCYLGVAKREHLFPLGFPRRKLGIPKITHPHYPQPRKQTFDLQLHCIPEKNIGLKCYCSIMHQDILSDEERAVCVVFMTAYWSKQDRLLDEYTVSLTPYQWYVNNSQMKTFFF